MFVRWKSYKWRNTESYYAYLVQSQRNEEGHPRQIVAAYLGKPPRGWNRDGFILVKWWQDVNNTLDGFNIEGKERKRIIARLAERYREPTDHDMHDFRIYFAASVLDDDEMDAWARGELDWP